MRNQTQRRSNIYEFRRPKPKQGNSNRRTQASKKQAAYKRRFRRLVLLVSGALLGTILLIIVIWLSTYKNGMEVYVNNKPVGFVKGLEVTAEELQKTAEAKIVSEIGTNIKVNEAVTIKALHVSKKNDFNELNHIVSEIKKNLTYTQEAAIITVEGIDIAIVNSKAEAEIIIEDIKKSYDKEDQNIIQSEIIEEYSITSKYVSHEDIMTTDMVKNALTRQTEVNVTYTIASGDSLWKIAMNSGISLEKLMQINEGLTVDTALKVGREITLVVQKPLLSVRTVEESTTNSLLPRSVDYHENPAMPSSYKNVISEGQDGQAIVTKRTIRENGIVVSTGEAETEVITNPINDVVEIGTRK